MATSFVISKTNTLLAYLCGIELAEAHHLPHHHRFLVLWLRFPLLSSSSPRVTPLAVVGPACRIRPATPPLPMRRPGVGEKQQHEGIQKWWWTPPLPTQGQISDELAALRIFAMIIFFPYME